jgi:two-component system, OmpR family, sensor kinase
MNSLRGRLLIALCIAVSVVGTILAGIAYRQVTHETKELLDHQLAQIASIVAGRASESFHPSQSDEDIQVAVWSADGKVQYSSVAPMSMPLTLTTGFSEMILGSKPYRVYATVIDGRRIEVAQPIDTREDQAEAAALAAFLPILVLLPVLAVVIALVIRALLQPVRNLAVAVSRRDTFAREPLQANGLPAEVMPLVDEINRLLERQNETVQRERNFIADAAHALRTPLAALQLQADVLDGSSDPTERLTRLSELRAGIRRAARLLDQLLSLARIDSDTNTSAGAVNLGSTLNEVRALYQAAVAGNRMTLRVDTDLNTTVRGDDRRLLLICTNLLDNALRHTPPGGSIEVRAGVQGKAARIEIWDEGPGLKPDQLERVFERFYCAPGSERTGSGLGLATVASVVKQLDGYVSLHNRTDRCGLIARVILPLMPGVDV